MNALADQVVVEMARLREALKTIQDNAWVPAGPYFSAHCAYCHTASLHFTFTISSAGRGEYARWSLARIQAREDPRDVKAFVTHLNALGADWRRPELYGLPA